MPHNFHTFSILSVNVNIMFTATDLILGCFKKTLVERFSVTVKV